MQMATLPMRVSNLKVEKLLIVNRNSAYSHARKERRGNKVSARS